MGGQSEGSFVVADNVGILAGTVRDVPSLDAPGFIKIQTTVSNNYPDISTCSHLVLEAMSSNTNVNYAGWRMGIGNSRPSAGRRHAYGHKTTFAAPRAQEYENISMPLNSFTNLWNPATGDPIVSCEEDPQYCPDLKTLTNVQTISIWAEGINGPVALSVRGVYATGCDGKYPYVYGVTSLDSSSESRNSAGTSLLVVVAAAILLNLVTWRR